MSISWSQTCNELEFGLSRTIYLASSEVAPASRSATSLRLVCDQDSVMKFGLKQTLALLQLYTYCRIFTENTHKHALNFCLTVVSPEFLRIYLGLQTAGVEQSGTDQMPILSK